MSKENVLPFRTQFTAGEKHYYCPTGEKTEMRHTAHMKDGRRFLVPDKEVAIYDLIQASREACEIENIIRRATEGDYNALNAVNGVYSDITNCPSSIAEAQQFIINAKNEFEQLPKEIKAKFEYNPELYIAEMGADTKSWCNKMGYTEAAIKLQKEKEEMAKYEDLTRKAMENLATISTGEQIKNGGAVNE